MVNNQTPCVILKVTADYDYIYNVIDYIAFGNANYNYLISRNRLQLQARMFSPIYIAGKVSCLNYHTYHVYVEIVLDSVW